MALNVPDRQAWSAEGYDRNARFVSDLGAGVLVWLNPQSGEHILDVGCGDGALTAKIAACGATVVGVDISEQLLEAARARGVEVLNCDATALPFDNAFDAVFSNSALHWVTPPERAAQRMRRALKPGGRLVAEFGGHGNVAAIVTALRAAAERFGGRDDLVAPWFFPTAQEYSSVLEGAGFKVRRMELLARPTPLPTGIEGWLRTFRQPFFDQFGPEALSWVIELLRPALADKSGQWTADYVRLRVEAIAIS